MRKNGKSEISKLQRKLWELCRQVAYQRFKNKDGTIDCYTCGHKDIQGSNRQLGHMWSKASLGANLKYDLRILRFQCFHDNINLGGAGADFYARMLKEIGKKKMTELEKERHQITKAKDHYLYLIGKYEQELNDAKEHKTF